MKNSLRIIVLIAFAVVVAASARIALAQGPQWLGFFNGTSPKDREADLRSVVGHFNRITVPGNNPRFTALCDQVGMRCKMVKDWGGTIHGCDDISQRLPNGTPIRDGSRVALCVPR